MIFVRDSVLRVLAAVLLLAGVGAIAPSAAEAQTRDRSGALISTALRMSPALAQGKIAVVVDVEHNELHFMQGRNILWSAPIGTGMALRLETGDRNWDFRTPNGVFHVQYKEENPVWNAPDWFFIEHGRPIPPANDPQRRFPGVLGAAAVYISRGLAIHGTDKPDLLGQRVSHGCIRLHNEYAQRLYHNVQPGTEVVIIGEVDDEIKVIGPGVLPPGAGPADRATQRLRDRAKAQWEGMLKELAALSTEDLIAQLDEELSARPDPEATPAWPNLAAEAVRRVRKGDVEVAQGMLELTGAIRDRRVRTEYGTFLVAAYSRGAPTVARALAGMNRAQRERAAGMIVETALAQFHPGTDERIAPWPTRRIPRSVLEEEAQAGWDVLANAERAYRERRGNGRAAGGEG